MTFSGPWGPQCPAWSLSAFLVRPSLDATCSPTLWLSLAQPRRGQHETPKVTLCLWTAVSRLSGRGSWQQDGRGYLGPPDTKPDTCGPSLRRPCWSQPRTQALVLSGAQGVLSPSHPVPVPEPCCHSAPPPAATGFSLLVQPHVCCIWSSC